MKKLVAALAALSLTAPVMADPVIDKWNTFHSMGCMLLRECTDGVIPVESMADVKMQLPDLISNEEIDKEMDDLFAKFKELGIDVYLADGKYFVRNTRGIYSTEHNRFFLNPKNIFSASDILAVTRHEGWHAAQDCMAGTLYNNHIAVIHHDGYIPNSYRIRADVAYGGGPAVPWETEAMWASEQPYVTSNALAACANPNGKMWDVYPPTPMTGEWLVKNGFWDGVQK